MDPFHVICETCHARLKISSESVIGQIHACPKCESMVQIVPPAGWMTSDSLVASNGAESQALKLGASEVPAVMASHSLLAWSIGGAAAVLLVASVAALLWPRDGATDANSPAVAMATSPEPELDSTAAEQTADELAAAPAGDDVVDERFEEAQIADASDEIPIEPAGIADELPDLPLEDTGAVAESGKDGTEPAAPLDPPSDTTITNDASETPPQPAAESRGPVLKFDPLDFDPSQLSLGGAAGGAPAEASGSVASDGVPESQAAGTAAEMQNALPEEPEPLEPAGDPLVNVRVGPTPTDALRPRNVAEQMAMAVELIEMPAIPLAQFVDTISEMADVPITIDPASLLMTGVSPRATVKVQARDTTLDEVLNEALRTKRLGVIERDGQLIVIQPAADRRRSVDYELKDLLEPAAADAAGFAEMIKRLVAPDAWQKGLGTIAVDGTKLRVDQASGVHAQILILCERLRLARGLATRSRYPAELLSIESPYESLSATLGKQTTFTFLPWTRLADVVRHWQESLGVTILVDWNALANEELAPSSPIACAAIAKPWGAALDAVLEPLGLTWWAVDGETIQITSSAAMADIARIEFYPVPKKLREQFVGNDALINALEEELREQAGIVADRQTQIEFDMPSERLIVLGSPAVQRFLSSRLGEFSPHERPKRDEMQTRATPIGTP